MTISQNAVAVLVKMSAATMTSEAFPMTNKAGGSKEHRAAVAELKKAGMITTFTNSCTPEGCTMVKFSKAAKEYLSAMGEVGHCHTGVYAAHEGSFKADYLVSSFNTGNQCLETRHIVKVVNISCAAGKDAVEVVTQNVLKDEIVSSKLCSK